EDSLPDRVQTWIRNAVDPAATVRATERLHGGTSSLLHAVSLDTATGTRDFVLRRFDNVQWLREEPDLARHEAESLRLAVRVREDTPEVVAFDETGSGCGAPAVLMTRLGGAVVLSPPDGAAWLDGLARSLCRIHAVDAGDFPWKYFTYTDLAAFGTPSWSRCPEHWSAAIAVARGPRPSYPPRFIHRDYHPANVLWQSGAVSGIVDWVNACAGPAGIDVGHCRVNLAQLFGVTTADAFLSAYEKYAGTAFRYDPYWDIVSLLDGSEGEPSVYAGWTALGVTGLTDTLMRDRSDDYLSSLVVRAAEFTGA
ncbi:MAG: phosphotransferase, partial [Akkermansiaceae bacterium]|nr:phosphotransferase [Armatimonadota bacterium]